MHSPLVPCCPAVLNLAEAKQCRRAIRARSFQDSGRKLSLLKICGDIAARMPAREVSCMAESAVEEKRRILIVDDDQDSTHLIRYEGAMVLLGHFI